MTGRDDGGAASEAVHCDDLIDDPAQPQCLRDYLRFERSPASDKYAVITKGGERPTLFANLKEPREGESYLGHWKDGHPAMKPVPLAAGQRVRVVMASRFGDVGITPDLEAEGGYVTRCWVSDLADFGEAP